MILCHSDGFKQDIGICNLSVTDNLMATKHRLQSFEMKELQLRKKYLHDQAVGKHIWYFVSDLRGKGNQLWVIPTLGW